MTTMEPTTQNDRDVEESVELLPSARAGLGALPMLLDEDPFYQVFFAVSLVK